MNVVAGVSSFFFRYFNKLLENYTFYVYKRIFFDNNLAELVYDPRVDVGLEERVELIKNIHLRIKGDKIFISAGMKAKYIALIGTNYSDNKENQRERMEYFKSEFKKWEFEVDIEQVFPESVPKVLIP